MIQKKFIVAGNWKMNKTIEESNAFMSKFASYVQQYKSEIILLVPYTNIESCISISSRLNIKIGAQNFHWDDFGAFTGEISVPMLSKMGVKSLLVGHSERRRYFGETDEIINRKIKKAVSSDINVILCVGETSEQRECNKEKKSVMLQIKRALSGVSKTNIAQIYIAYEPIWAIGTGKVATPQQANQMCRFIRMCIENMYGTEEGMNFKILYGGSVTEENCREIFLMTDIDGVLVGGASLDPDKFESIIKIADSISNEGSD